MRKKIIVSVSNDISSDQRVDKICNFLHDKNYEVVLIGRKLPNSKPINNRNYKVVRFKLHFNKGIMFYKCLNLRLFIYLLFNRFDYLLANDLDTLSANALASFIKRKKLFYDSHELFTEVPELNNRNLVKTIWKIIERISIKQVYKAYTVCESIADYYQRKYNIEFAVVRNLPKYRETKSDFSNRENILIYQGALNKDRGLELLIEAMQYIDNYVLIIAGNGDIKSRLKEMVNEFGISGKIKFPGFLNYTELCNLTDKAILGFSLEQNTNLNYYFSLPNKLFDYINAGVPVYCSDLPEIRNIVSKYEVGYLNNCNSPKELANKIQAVLRDKDLLLTWHSNCLKASTELTWQNEIQILEKIYF